MPSFRTILLAAGVVFCVGYSWYSVQGNAPNERSRIYLSVAMVERGEVQVDPEVRRFGKNWDLSRKDGTFYCNKPPGSSLLGVPVYWLARKLGGEGEWSMQGLFQLMRFGVMLPLALLGFVAIRRWMASLGISEPVVDVASVGWMLGSAAFHYAGAFFSHHIVAVGLVTAMWLLERVRREVGGSSGKPESAVGWEAAGLMLVAGLFLGLNGMTEYQAGIGSALVALWVVSVRDLRRLRLIVPFAVGAAICLAGLLYYNAAAFGGPLEFSYKYHISGGGGEPISHPQLEYFAGLMFSMHRGLLANAPWLVLLFPGIYVLYRRGRGKLAVLLAVIVAFRIVFLSSYKWWSGDWGFGPRHLVPIMGIAAVLAASAMDRWWEPVVGEAIAKGLVVCGIAYNQIQVAFLGELPPGVKNPLMDVALPFYEHGVVAPNLLTSWTQWRGAQSLVPLAVVVVLFVGFVLLRGISRRAGWGRKIAVVLLALVPTAAFGAVVYEIGETRKEKNEKRFRQSMERKLEGDIRWHHRDGS